MKHRVTNLLLGAILGGVLVQGIPSSAHSGSNPHLWKHIKSLQANVKSLQANVASLQMSDQTLNSNVQKLTSKTALLGPNGEYAGNVSNFQVKTTFICGGAAARWSGTAGLTLAC